jgi:hypothetical protein
VGHGDVTTCAVLLLKKGQFYREFAPEKVVPSDGGLFLEQLLVSDRIACRIDGLCSEPTKKAFPQNVHQNWVKEGVDGLIVEQVSAAPREPLPNPRKRTKKELLDSNRN